LALTQHDASFVEWHALFEWQLHDALFVEWQLLDALFVEWQLHDTS